MRDAMAGPKKLSNVHLPDGSRSVQSPWVWRGFLFMSLVAVGICIDLVQTDRTTFGVLWAVIAIGWFAISMWLWRKHVRDDDEAFAARQAAGRRTK